MFAVTNNIRKFPFTLESVYDKGAKQQPSLEPNEGVRLRSGKQWIPARADCPANTPRSYHVTMETGQLYRRNQKDLLKSNEPPPLIIEPHVEDTCPNTVIALTADAMPTTNQPTTAAFTSSTMPTQGQDPIVPSPPAL